MEVFYHKNSESDIWNDFKGGDRDAFNLIYYHYAELLLNNAYKFTSDRALAEDCLQELFIDLWRTREKLATPLSIKFYLLQSLRRRIVRKLKYQHKHIFFVANLSEIKGISEYKFSIETKLINSEDKTHLNHKLKKLIDNLSNLQREVIYHRFYNELSMDQISQVMDIPKKSVYNAMSNGISALRKAFIMR